MKLDTDNEYKVDIYTSADWSSVTQAASSGAGVLAASWNLAGFSLEIEASATSM
jgi:hypothetical protein